MNDKRVAHLVFYVCVCRKRPAPPLTFRLSVKIFAHGFYGYVGDFSMRFDRSRLFSVFVAETLSGLRSVDQDGWNDQLVLHWPEICFGDLVVGYLQHRAGGRLHLGRHVQVTH